MKLPKQITIILPSLIGGGAERISLDLATHWSSLGIKVVFVLLQDIGELSSEVPSCIHVHSLNAPRLRQAFLPLIRYLKSDYSDVIWVGLWPLTSIAVVAWKIANHPGKIVTTDHNNLTHSCIKHLGLNPLLLNLTLSLTYSLASACTAVSRGVKDDITSISYLPPSKVTVIYNPAARQSHHPGHDVSTSMFWRFDQDYKKILAVGSLKHQKDFRLLLTAFSIVSSAINAKLVILGEGDERVALERLCHQLSISDRVYMPGFVDNVSDWYQNADLFVLSSRWEGFGNVIVEALHHGVPVVSTDCPSGPAEILQSGKYGRLVPVSDSTVLARAIIDSLSDSHDQSLLRKRASDFSLSVISTSYLNLFTSLELGQSR